MAFTDDVFPPDDVCEICGARLDDEIVIQEFADGSLARLCSECAAGATLGMEQHMGHDPVEPAPESRPLPETDPLERTRELLTPVVDLIGLQREMQGALERLAASLETFAAGVLTENLDKTATVEDRVHGLERELEATRARLRETEALLSAASASSADTEAPTETADLSASEADLAAAAAATAAAAAAASTVDAAESDVSATTGAETPDTLSVPAAEAVPDAEAPPVGAPPIEAAPGEAATAEPAEPAGDTESIWPTEEVPEENLPPAVPVETLFPPPSESESIPAAGGEEEGEWASPKALDSAEVPIPAGVPAGPPAEPSDGATHGFSIEEVQAAQRYFNESPFTGKTREVQTSLGKPRANLTRAAGPESRAFVTIFWDIVWYQYLVDMRVDITGEQRVVLHREGMDLDELAYQFKEKNAIVDDNGRLDASELEIKLLSDPTTLITEMTPDVEKALEDATEEVWDQQIAPEFKWDD